MKNFFNPKLWGTFKPGKDKKKTLFYNPNKLRTFVFGIGTGAFLLALAGVVWLWYPLGKEIISYQYFKWQNKGMISQNEPIPTPKPAEPTPTLPPVPDESFSVLLPKLDTEAKVFPNIDPTRPEVYQEVLKDGVAHAAGSGFPGTGKPVYLFAHSTNAEWNVVRYNAVFFLLNDLNPGDRVQVVYNNKMYHYEVFDKKVVGANDVSYLTDYQPGREEVILQTCWPPGTILKRLLVFARLE
jgi:sortase A